MAAKTLETDLEVQLFDRTTRSFELTAAHQLFRDSLAPVLADLDRGVAQVNTGIQGEAQRRVRQLGQLLGHPGDSGTLPRETATA